MAARAKKTKARGEESPDAELGAEVDEEDAVADVVFDPVELAWELVFEAEELLELEPVVVVELRPLELVTVGREDEEEPVEEEPEVVEAAAEEELLTPPINWNCSL
jgi:hypothetical protein